MYGQAALVLSLNISPLGFLVIAALCPYCRRVFLSLMKKTMGLFLQEPLLLSIFRSPGVKINHSSWSSNKTQDCSLPRYGTMLLLTNRDATNNL